MARGEAEAEPTALVTSFQRAVDLGKKVLPSSQEVQTEKALFSSKELIQYAEAQLLSTDEAAQTKTGEERRMQSIDFFEAALRWRENPRRQEVLEAMSRVVERPVASLELPLAFRRSLGGDVIELYTVLLQQEPTRAEDIAAGAPAQQLALFRFANNMVRRSQNQPIGEKE
jgi:hypothetical protein